LEILLVSATPFEIAPFLEHLRKEFDETEAQLFTKGTLVVRPLVTGVGMIQTAWNLGLYFALNKPALAINAGIAGAFDRTMPIGEVVHVVTERFGDLGIEEADGRFSDIFEMGFMDAEADWHNHGQLLNPTASLAEFLPKINGVSVNKVSGTRSGIDALLSKYPDLGVESMEGAAFFLACLHAGVPFLEIRSISNHVEPRNREAWDVPLAIQNLNEALIALISSLS
jgi:futalosine hydrolase